MMTRKKADNGDGDDEQWWWRAEVGILLVTTYYVIYYTIYIFFSFFTFCNTICRLQLQYDSNRGTENIKKMCIYHTHAAPSLP